MFSRAPRRDRVVQPDETSIRVREHKEWRTNLTPTSE
eukprot:CAMPEP_0119407252 /NCGR_PEP_ID=MMETSP1335-20130426/1224_1 /TAXON_ID=259385 /ORGANISM="Chrysoculter rhomboideus, Strain RCC1486" /LENGTH=36 /DNA_ID= /DNA_START= /DNA_END= /DNA_ORIENTATION=